MAGCVLRISGLSEELPQWLKDVSKNQNLIVIDVSDSDECFRDQIEIAFEYLTSNIKGLQKLKENNPNMEWGLDFGVWLESKLAQSFVFPSGLVNIAGMLGMQLEVSIYAASNS